MPLLSSLPVASPSLTPPRVGAAKLLGATRVDWPNAWGVPHYASSCSFFVDGFSRHGGSACVVTCAGHASSDRTHCDGRDGACGRDSTPPMHSLMADQATYGLSDVMPTLGNASAARLCRRCCWRLLVRVSSTSWVGMRHRHRPRSLGALQGFLTRCESSESHPWSPPHLDTGRLSGGPAFLAQEQSDCRPAVGAHSSLQAGRGSPKQATGDRSADRTGFAPANGDTRCPAIWNLIVERGGGPGHVVPSVQWARVRTLPEGPVRRNIERFLVDLFM